MSDVLVGIQPHLEDIKKTQSEILEQAKKLGEQFGTKMSDAAQQNTEKGFDKLKGTILKFAAAVGAGLLFKKMIDNAIEAENATTALANAMKVAGTFTQDAQTRFEEYSKSLQRTTGVSDDFINQQAAMLVSIGKLRGEGLERATKAALDFSAATGKDLGASFDAMARAAQGNVAGLTKYIGKIDESIPKSERFAVALQRIEASFGGLAEGKMNTFEGALTRLSNGFNDLLENAGSLITRSPVVVALIKEIAKWFEQWADKVEAVGKSGDVIGSIVIKLLEVGQAITQYVLPPIELLYNIGVFVFKSIASAIQEMVIVPLSAVGRVIGWIGEKVGVMSAETANALKTFNDSALATSQTLTEETSKSFDNLFNFDSSLAASNFVTKLQEVAAAAAPVIQETRNALNPLPEWMSNPEAGLSVGESFTLMMQGMSNAATEFKDNAVENFRKVGASMFQSVGNAAGQAFASFGKAVAKGENALQAFLNSLVASMGQMAIQLGTQFILQGIAYTWAGMGNGPPLIAAGAALAAFGGILSAVGGGGSSAGSGAAAGGGGSGGGGVGGDGLESMTPSDDTQELERRKPDTNITVQVQGNILDRRQTGLEIAEVIQETFGTNGINYNT